MGSWVVGWLGGWVVGLMGSWVVGWLGGWVVGVATAVITIGVGVMAGVAVEQAVRVKNVKSKKFFMVWVDR